MLHINCTAFPNAFTNKNDFPNAFTNENIKYNWLSTENRTKDTYINYVLKYSRNVM